MGEEAYSQQAEDYFAVTHEVADPDHMSDMEKKHTPVIHVQETGEAGLRDVTVVVGELMRHPNEPAHFIQWIELWADDRFIARYDMSPVLAEPRITARVSVGAASEIRALGHCNIHGTWLASASVGV